MTILRSSSLLFALLLSSSASYAQDSNCASIKDSESRLACYDSEKAPQRKVAKSSAKAGKERGKKLSYHNWVIDESIDPMTDKKRCTALYKGEWSIQANDHDFMIPLRKRGGVEYYTLRFNDEPADDLRNASTLEKDVSAVVLGYNFDRAYNGKRLRARIHTLVAGTIEEDIDLAGFKDAVDYIRANCQPSS
jgi:hypothetical protein